MLNQSIIFNVPCTGFNQTLANKELRDQILLKNLLSAFQQPAADNVELLRLPSIQQGDEVSM